MSRGHHRILSFAAVGGTHHYGRCDHPSTAVVQDGKGGYNRVCLVCEHVQPLTRADVQRIMVMQENEGDT